MKQGLVERVDHKKPDCCATKCGTGVEVLGVALPAYSEARVASIDLTERLVDCSTSF
jgi:hypothetical protein